jgi:GTPase involved in cell partitioning and DNA repair
VVEPSAFFDADVAAWDGVSPEDMRVVREQLNVYESELTKASAALRINEADLIRARTQLDVYESELNAVAEAFHRNEADLERERVRVRDLMARRGPAGWRHRWQRRRS